jgi:divalent metal cation (Fe/Co/Zn/Cd) transporter
LALIANGKHLQNNTYSTVGINIGLIIIFITNQTWFDRLVAIFFSIIIIAIVYRILSDSIAGIIDEADEDLLKKSGRKNRRVT